MMKSILLEDVACPMGCASGDEVVLTGRDLLHDLPGEYAIVKCKTCGLMRTNPRPTPDTIGHYYPDDYGPYMGTRIADSGIKSTVSSLKETANRLLRVHTQSLPPCVPGLMLEIGCASGAFLKQMADKGWHVDGIEFSEMAAKSARESGFSVYAGSVESAPEPAGKYDMVVGWMVLEHLHDPVTALNKLHRWTNTGGWLVISVPNAGCFQLGWFKNQWYPLHLPAHLYHFTPETLSVMLKSSGWKVERILYQRVMTDFVGSLGYVVADKWPNSFLAKFLTRHPGVLNAPLYPIALLLSLFGQTARMTIWARRVG